MSEQVDMLEVKTEPNESGKFYSVFKVSNMILSNHSRQYKVTSECKNHLSTRVVLLDKVIYISNIFITFKFTILLIKLVSNTLI